MNETLRYKNYISTVHFSADDEVFHGKVIGVNDLITFEGNSVKELKKSFKEAIEDYIDTCKELNKDPDKTYKGSFNVRVPVNLHRRAALLASQKRVTLNELMKIAISFTIKHEDEIDEEIQQLNADLL